MCPPEGIILAKTQRQEEAWCIGERCQGFSRAGVAVEMAAKAKAKASSHRACGIYSLSSVGYSDSKSCLAGQQDLIRSACSTVRCGGTHTHAKRLLLCQLHFKFENNNKELKS